MRKIAGLEGPYGLRYFRCLGLGADALLGALEESGDAQRYDINGAGRIVYVSVSA